MEGGEDDAAQSGEAKHDPRSHDTHYHYTRSGHTRRNENGTYINAGVTVGSVYTSPCGPNKG